MASKKTSKEIGVLPFGDRVLVRPLSEDEAKGKKGNSHFGIILPDAVSKEKSAEGIVLAVGEGRFENGQLIPMRIKVGDRVFFSKYAYDEVTEEGEELYLLKEDTILAIIQK